MYGLMRRRSMMTMVLPVPTERPVYSLEDYTCDGTVNTFINTGIRLFSKRYTSFRMELEYDDFDLINQTSQETISECKFIQGAGTNLPGFTIRASSEKDDVNKMNINFPPGLENTFYENASSARVSLYYDGVNNSVTVNGDTIAFGGDVFHLNPVTIGGRNYSSGKDRFVKCHIISLKIFATPKKDGETIYKLENYQCDGTAATAINTGLYLFDASAYPNGWSIEFDFTIGDGNGGNASYLRCRNAASPYNGFCLRRNYGNANQTQCQVFGGSALYNSTSGTRHSALIEKYGTKCSMGYDNEKELSSNLASVVAPLVIGGEFDDTTQQWNTSRFSKIYIHSLIIKAL